MATRYPSKVVFSAAFFAQLFSSAITCIVGKQSFTSLLIINVGKIIPELLDLDILDIISSFLFIYYGIAFLLDARKEWNVFNYFFYFCLKMR